MLYVYIKEEKNYLNAATNFLWRYWVDQAVRCYQRGSEVRHKLCFQRKCEREAVRDIHIGFHRSEFDSWDASNVNKMVILVIMPCVLKTFFFILPVKESQRNNVKEKKRKVKEKEKKRKEKKRKLSKKRKCNRNNER